MSKGFKKIPFEWRGELLKLSGSQLKVWMAHYLRSNKDDKVEMSNSQLMRECDIGLSAVKLAKRWLKENGWLVVDKAAYRDLLTQQWISPELTAAYPGLDNNLGEPTPGLESNPGNSETRVENQPTDSRVGKAATGKATLPVDTLLPEDTHESDPSGLPVNTEEEEVEEASSASSLSTPKTEQDYEEEYKEHSVQTYLMPIVADYGGNGNCREQAGLLYEILKEVRLADTMIGAVIKYHRCCSDPFMADRISTWDGLLKMLRKPGMIRQFRNSQRLAATLNPKQYEIAMEKFGTSAFGVAIAKIIEEKKAMKGRKS